MSLIQAIYLMNAIFHTKKENNWKIEIFISAFLFSVMLFIRMLVKN